MMAAHDVDLRMRRDQHDDRSLGELFGELSAGFSQLMREEVQLAKVELKEEASKATRAGGLFGGAALAGYMALLLVSFAAVWGLAEIMPTGFAFLIVGVVYGIVGAVLFLRGRSEMKHVRPVPDQTVESLKEDARWARAQLP